MKTPSDRDKKIAQYIAKAFNVEKPSIRRHLDEAEKSDAFILRAGDTPSRGVTTYSTVGLSDHPLIFRGREFETRVEIVGACLEELAGFDDVVATLAFCVINSGWFCAPGSIFPDVMTMYKLSDTMSDIYFTTPFLWEEHLKPLKIDGIQVSWLLAVPISKQEAAYTKEFGPYRLEDLFVEKQINIFDLNRPSVV